MKLHWPSPQPKNIDTLCKAVVDTAEQLEPTLTSTAEDISRRFTKVFTLFAACHNQYNSSMKFSDADIKTLGWFSTNMYRIEWLVAFYLTETNIRDFMAFYRETFPETTVLPKMHIMEVHIVPWLKQHRVGLGLMGEQGAESIHAAVNSIKRLILTYLTKWANWNAFSSNITARYAPPLWSNNLKSREENYPRPPELYLYYSIQVFVSNSDPIILSVLTKEADMYTQQWG